MGNVSASQATMASTAQAPTMQMSLSVYMYVGSPPFHYRTVFGHNYQVSYDLQALPFYHPFTHDSLASANFDPIA